MTTLTELINTSGLAVQKQNEIAQTLGIFFNKAAEWDATIQSIVITSPEETGKMKMAREGRLTLKNMRLEADKLVKSRRDEVKYLMANYVLEDKLWLKAGQMIEVTFKNLETKLEEKEKFAERWEAEQKEIRTNKRLLQLSDWSENDQYTDKGIIENMSDETFDDYLATVRKMKEEKVREAEERIAREKAEAEERERIRKENERLKAEAEAREKEMAKQKAKAEAELKASEEKARKEREAAEMKIKAEAEKKLKAEREARAKVEAELKAKAEAESKVIAEKKAKELAEKKAAERELKLNQKTRLNRWVDSLTITAPVGLENDFTVTVIESLFNQFKAEAKNRIANL